MASTNLANAKTAKNDEFYTQYPDIQKEINAYLDYDLSFGSTMRSKGRRPGRLQAGVKPLLIKRITQEGATDLSAYVLPPLQG